MTFSSTSDQEETPSCIGAIIAFILVPFYPMWYGFVLSKVWDWHFQWVEYPISWKLFAASLILAKLAHFSVFGYEYNKNYNIWLGILMFIMVPAIFLLSAFLLTKV